MGELRFHSHAGPQLCICAVDWAWKLLNLKRASQVQGASQGPEVFLVKGGQSLPGRAGPHSWLEQPVRR